MLMMARIMDLVRWLDLLKERLVADVGACVLGRGNKI